jgi:hypothetical protein
VNMAINFLTVVGETRIVLKKLVCVEGLCSMELAVY